jgi:hypothetical protein
MVDPTPYARPATTDRSERLRALLIYHVIYSELLSKSDSERPH